MVRIAGVDYNSTPCEGPRDFTFHGRPDLPTTLLDLIVGEIDPEAVLCGGLETAFRFGEGYLTALVLAKDLVKVSEDCTQADLGDGWEPLNEAFVYKVKTLAEEGLKTLEKAEILGLSIVDTEGRDLRAHRQQDSLLAWHKCFSNVDFDIAEEEPTDPIARMLAAGFKKGR